jgi:hypothetical protein
MRQRRNGSDGRLSGRAARFAAVLVVTLMAVMTGRLRAQWVPFSPPDSLPDRAGLATVYDPVNDRIYMIGGDPGEEPTGSNSCQRYDPNRDTWETMRPMPTPRVWTGGAYIRGKIYVAGGEPGDLGVNEEYTVADGSWRTRAPLPVATFACQIGVWRDSLMYIMGGIDPNWNGMETVRIYSPFTDTWTVGTPMPRPGDMGSGTIVGDTIYITGSYNRPTGRVWTEMLRGAINPADPTQITWFSGPRLPAPAAAQSTASLHGKVYWFGGYESEFSSRTRRGWVYDPATGGIDSIPSLPPTVGRGLAGGGAVGREVSNELFQVAGSADSATVRPYNKIRFAPLAVAEESRRDVEPATLEVWSSVASRNVQIRYALRRSGWVKLQVQDITGRVVRALVSGQMQAGSYAAAWDGRDRYGRPAGSGVYFCRLQAGGYLATKKLLMMR